MLLTISDNNVIVFTIRKKYETTFSFSLWPLGGHMGQLGAGSPTSLDSPVFNTVIFPIMISKQ